MSQLIQAMERTGLRFEAAESGRWVRFAGETCTVYVCDGGQHFATWCERWDDRRVERYLTAEEAIIAGRRRSAIPLRPPISAGLSSSAEVPAIEEMAVPAV